MTTISWLIFICIFGGITAVMIWSKRFVKDVSGFLVAGRKTRVWLGMSNSFSGGLGLVSIAYIAQQGFTGGLAFLWIALFRSLIVMTLFGVFGFGIQRLRASKAMTAGQYHEMRYSKGVRLLVGLVLGIGGVMNMAVFPITGAKFLSYFLGLPEVFSWAGVAFDTIPTLTAGLIVAAIFFTVICGQVGVMITDYLQSIVIAAGLLTLVFIIYKMTDGMVDIRDTLLAMKGEEAFNPLIGDVYGWQWVLWVFASIIWAPFCSAALISKNASATNTKVVRITTLLGSAVGNGKTMIMLSLGVGALMFMGDVAPAGMEASEYKLVVTAMYIKQIAGPLLSGLLLGAFVSAFISTNNTYFLAWAGIWVNDVICPLLPHRLSTRAHLLLLRLVIMLIGVFLFFFGVWFKIEDSVLEFIMMTGTMWIGCGIAVVFGLYWKRACTAGAYAAIISATILPILHLTLQKTWPAYLEAVPAKTAGVAIIAVAVSLITLISLMSNKPTKFVDYSGIVREDESHKLNG